METFWYSPISPKKVLARILLAIFILVFLSVFLQSLKYVFHISFTALNFIIFLFNTDQERNIPTFFTVLLLLYAFMLLWSITFQKCGTGDKYLLHWRLLTFLFFMVAADEFMATHEMISEIIREKYHVGGIFYYAWVIPFSVLLFFLAIFYWRFIFNSLPTKTRNLMLLAAALYVGGAIGMEMAGSYFYIQNGVENMTNALLSSAEEGMEMTGIAIFIYALLQYKLAL